VTHPARADPRLHRSSSQHNQAGQPYRSFGGLLEHLVILTT
jgi:hypothetical protein